LDNSAFHKTGRAAKVNHFNIVTPSLASVWQARSSQLGYNYNFPICLMFRRTFPMANKVNTSNKKAPSGGKSDDKPVTKTISDNRKARHDFEILERFECGIELTGTEVKSLRLGRANLQDSFARIEAGEAWLYNCNISAYEYGNRFNHEPTRKRRLLMHSREIFKLNQKINEKGLTLIPLKLYFKRNWVKVEIATAKGKQLYDKRESIGKRDAKRSLDRLAKQTRRA
jgi:SsrA-binding protein